VTFVEPKADPIYCCFVDVCVIVFPVMTDEPRTTKEGIIDYFVNFLKNKPQGVITDGITLSGSVRTLFNIWTVVFVRLVSFVPLPLVSFTVIEYFHSFGQDWAEDSGVYEFTMGANGSKVLARYSFVYVKEDGEWKIAHHHSSAMPEGLLAATAKIKKLEELFAQS
jgi:hypothetical protein